MNLSLLTDPSEIKAAGWSSFVCSHPDATVFQSPEMHDFFSSVPGFEPVIIAVADEHKKLAGVLLGVTIREMKGLAGYFSSRTVVYGGPLVDSQNPDRDSIPGPLLQGLIHKVKNHSIFIQFRNFYDPKPFIPYFENTGFHLRDRLNLIVDTSSIDTIVKNMSDSRWRQIRKGLGLTSPPSPPGPLFPLSNRSPRKRGSERGPGGEARIIVPSNLSQVREFYDILHQLYRYKVKKPLPGWGFFEQFYEFSKQGMLGVILLVEYQEKIIGGILAPVTPGKTIYEWYVCGLDQEYKQVYPSVLATWAALEYALKHDIPQFDFMGVGIPGREYGVREFKSRFGGEMVNYGRFGRINNRVLYAVSEAGYNILSMLRKI